MPHRNIFRKILFCTDFSENCRLAFLHALNIAGGNPEGELVIFHVVPEPSAQFWKSYLYEVDSIDQKARHDIDQKIAEAYLTRIPQEMRYSVKLAVGEVNRKILETAETEEVDLIVIGRQGTSRFNTLFLGNTTERIARKAPCPVLIVPEEHEPPGGQET
jgi:nucleotide-binding universal stress UspA family protein